MANVQEYKKKIVNDMTKLMKQYNIVGLVNMEDMPAPQLQSMRSELRGKVNLFMTKKRFMKIAIEKVKDEKKNIEELEKYFEGMPALIFTNESPFKLSKILKKSKSKAPAKAGQIAPDDIVVNKGPTPFAPGPIISELSSAGLKVGVESGKVAIKEDTVVAKKGEKINPKVAEILTRLDIKPMEIGLGLVAAYEGGIIYQKDVLDVDEKQYSDNINLAASQAFNLAFNITYVTKDNISFLIGKAFNDTKALGISQEIFDKGIIEGLLGKAEMSMLSLKDDAKIETKIQIEKERPETQEKPRETEKSSLKEEIKKEKVEEKKKIEEKPAEIEKTEVEHKPEVEVKKELPKPEVKVEPKKPEIKEEIEIKKVHPKLEIKEEPKPQVKEGKPKEDIDKKISRMVDNVKKYIEGKEETAADILEDVKKGELQEEKKQRIEEQKKEEKIPSAYDLKNKKEETKQEDIETKQEKEQKEIEELTKELIKKGTLRKNK